MKIFPVMVFPILLNAIPLPDGERPTSNYIPKSNLSVKVLDFVQFGVASMMRLAMPSNSTISTPVRGARYFEGALAQSTGRRCPMTSRYEQCDGRVTYDPYRPTYRELTAGSFPKACRS